MNLLKRISIIVVPVFFILACGIREIKAQDDYLVGTYYYLWYNENSWFDKGLKVTTDSLLHDTTYYNHFIREQFRILMNDTSPSDLKINPYINHMKNDNWRQNDVIRAIGPQISPSNDSLFVDSIAKALTGKLPEDTATVDTGYPIPRSTLDKYTAQLVDSGVLRPQIIDSILHRPEQYQWFVESQYKGLQGRPSDTSGLNYWTNQMEDSVTKDSVIMEFCASYEFWNRFASHSKDTLVDSMFYKLCGRLPSGTERTHYVDIINNNYRYLCGALTPHQPPALGEYISSDTDIAEQHIDEAVKHGIKLFVICDW